MARSWKQAHWPKRDGMIPDVAVFWARPGESAADNSAGFSQALSSCNKRIRIPEGVYDLERPLVVGAGVVLEGDGSASTILKWPTFATPTTCVTITNGGRLQGVTIDGTACPDATGIDLGGADVCSRATLDDVIVQNFSNAATGVGLRVGSSQGTTVRRGCKVIACGRGILQDGQDNGDYPTTNEISAHVSSCTVGLSVVRGTLNAYRGCTFESNLTHIDIHPGGQLNGLVFDGCWLETAYVSSVNYNLTALPTVIARVSHINGWSSAGTPALYERIGIDPVTDGALFLTISNTIAFDMLLTVAERDTLVIDNTDYVGPLIIYGKVVANYLGRSKFAAYFDADYGVTGTSPVTAWASSQRAACAVTFTSATISTVGPYSRRAVCINGTDGGALSGVDLTPWQGVNRRFHFACAISLTVAQPNGTVESVFGFTDASGAYQGLRLDWSGGVAYITLIRQMGSVAKWFQHGTTIAPDGSMHYLAVSFDGTKLLLSDETGNINGILDATITSAFAPTAVSLGANPVWGSSSGLNIRYWALWDDWPGGNISDGWNMQHDAQVLRHWLRRDAASIVE